MSNSTYFHVCVHMCRYICTCVLMMHRHVSVTMYHPSLSCQLCVLPPPDALPRVATVPNTVPSGSMSMICVMERTASAALRQVSKCCQGVTYVYIGHFKVLPKILTFAFTFYDYFYTLCKGRFFKIAINPYIYSAVNVIQLRRNREINP